MWTWFKDLIFIVVEFLESFMGDWGLAIIGITLIFRTLLIPLMTKQTKSSAKMQKVQPKMQELQTKYKDNPEKLQEEMSKFYKENKISPLGGCLLPLLQMPLFIALYQVLQKLPERVVEETPTFFNIIPDLSVSMQSLWSVVSADGGIANHWAKLLPYVILVLLGGLSTVIPQFLQKNNAAGASSIKMMSVFMGAMMLYIGWISPAGVLLYWITSSVFGAVQQVIVQHMVTNEDEAEAKAITVEPVSVVQKSKKPKKSAK